MIPEELKQLNRWVCATDTDKIPWKAWEYTPASASDPHTWSDYHMATEAVRDGYYAHTGFVFKESDGYVGIDIDIGFTDEFQLTDEAYDIIHTCKSYCELSKSGRGFHIILKGSLPFTGRNNRQGVEIYKDKRFFILTGRTTAYTGIIENQEAIDYVVAKYFPENIREGKHPLFSERIYKPVWEPLNGKGIRVKPYYPPIPQGCRNVSLLSLGGSLLTGGASEKEIYKTLSKVNTSVCNPPLQDKEVKLIVKSVMKYDKKK